MWYTVGRLLCERRWAGRLCFIREKYPTALFFELALCTPVSRGGGLSNHCRS